MRVERGDRGVGSPADAGLGLEAGPGTVATGRRRPGADPASTCQRWTRVAPFQLA